MLNAMAPGSLLRNAISRAHWTQRQAAAQLGIQPSTLSKLLSGDRQPSLELAFKIQAILAVLTLGLSYPLLDRLGVTGIGLAWLLAQGSVAVVLLATELRPVLLSRERGY